MMSRVLFYGSDEICRQHVLVYVLYHTTGYVIGVRTNTVRPSYDSDEGGMVLTCNP